MTTLDDMPTRLTERGWKLSRAAGAFMALTGPLWTRTDTQGWACGVITTAQHLNPAGLVHGGLLTTLMDHALSAIAWQATDKTACLTVQLDTHFLSAAQAGEFIEARAHLVRKTRSLVFLRGTLTVIDREVLAAQAVMKIVKS